MTCLGISVRSATPALPTVIVLRQNKYFSDLEELVEAAICLTREPGGSLFRVRRKEKALDWLEKAYEDRDPIFWWIDGDQLYDSVRNEPRFQALVQKIDRTKAESKK